MFELSKLLLDKAIDRRAFISGLVKSGMTLAGANAIAARLAAADTPATAASSVPEPGRVVSGMTGGEVMAEFLKDWNIPYIFGLAGSEETGLLDALPDRPELHYTTCLHENAAMAMADGYSRSTGKTSIVQLHSVAGVAFAMGQLCTSYRDRIPVVVTAGRQSTNFRGHDGFLESPNLHMMPAEYAQWTWDVMNVETIPEVLRRAFLLAEAPPGGPTFITFSKDLFEVKVKAAEIIPRSRSQVSAEVAPREEDVIRIVDNLLAAQRPCLFVGNECIRHEISAEIASIAESVGAMVMNSVKIPVLFPNTHPNFVGEVVADDPDLGRRIDCFWSLGGNMFKLFNLPPEPVIPRSARVMHTSLVETEVGRNYPVDVATISSLKTTTRMVIEELMTRKLDKHAISERQRWVASYTSAQRQGYRDTARKEWNNTPIATSRLMGELDRVMDDNAYIISELITSDSYPRKFLTFDHTRPYAQRRREFYATSGVLGWGVGAAIGVKIGNPDKEVWCLTGDGCFNFGSQALWSAARYEAPIGVVVFNNGEYQANRMNQNTYRGRIYQTGKYIGVNLRHPAIQYVKMAEAYGIEAELVAEPDKLTAALQRCARAIRDGRPYLLDVKIARYFEGSDSDWYDYFSVARGLSGRS
jgi:benzoylformate decarboxylase